MKKILVTGNVGRDPESRYDANGAAFVSFSLAVTVGTKANPKTDWLEISCNGKTAELVQNFVRKGNKILIDGTPVAHAYLNKDGQAVGVIRVFANHIEFLSSRDKAEDITHPSPVNYSHEEH